MPWTNDQMWALINKPEPEDISRYDLIHKPDPEEILHFGILGMKWGVRRYQNEDGTLTEEGKKRYLNSDGSLTKEGLKEHKKGSSISKELDRIFEEKERQRDIEREEYLKNNKEPKLKSANDLIKEARNARITGKQVSDLMKKKHVDYEEIYLEMADEYDEFKNILDSEDSDDYRDAESVWYLKHKDDK